jgi:hypothetical protein
LARRSLRRRDRRVSPRDDIAGSADQEARMAKALKAGDEVSWKSHGGTAEGKVVKKVTSRTSIKDHKVDASEEEPQFLVETDDGKKAAHKAGALRKK